MNSQQRSEDDLEFSRAVEVLTRLRHHQGQSSVEQAVQAAARGSKTSKTLLLPLIDNRSVAN